MTPDRIKSPDSDPGGTDSSGQNPDVQDEPGAVRASRLGAAATSHVEIDDTQADEVIELVVPSEPLAIRGMIAGMRHHLRPRR